MIELVDLRLIPISNQECIDLHCGSLFEKNSAKTFMIWNPSITQKPHIQLKP